MSCHGRTFWTDSRRSVRGTTCWSTVFTGPQRADHRGSGRELVAAHDDGHVCAAAVGGLHLALHAATLVGPVGRDPSTAELVGDEQCLLAARGVDDEHRDVRRGGIEHALVVAGQQRAVDTEREPDARRRRSAEVLHEAVVATASTERVLRRVECSALVLEDRTAVVVEATHEPRFDGERDAERRQPALHDGEVLGGGVGVEVGDAGGGGDRRAVVRALGVEDAKRVACQRLATLGRQIGLLEVRTEGSDIAGPVVGLPEAVHDEGDPAQAQALEELPAEGDHLDVEVRIVGAEHLDTDLVELAVPAALGLLVPEVRTRVPRLPGRQRMVLDERPAHAGGPLRPQRDVAVALVDEVVHLLGDDVGRLADAREDPDVLEQRGDDLAVAGGLDDLGEHGREASPACGFGREDVAHPRARLEFRHGCARYRRAVPAVCLPFSHHRLGPAGTRRTPSRSA